MTQTAHLGNPALHFELTQMAARASGVDLAVALGAGALSTRGHADMITRCRGCAVVDVCEAHLAQGLVPEHCPNTALFGKLGG